MPSSSFFRWVLSLVAGGTKPVRQMAFFGSTTSDTPAEVARPLRYSMFFTVLFWANQYQVTKAVVLRIPVYVVHMYSFWRICNNTMFVIPAVWLCNFYLYIRKTIAGFMQTGTTNRKFHTYLIQYAVPNLKNFRRKGLIRTISAAWGIMVRVPVSTFLSHNGDATKRTWFRSKFFHTPSVYQAG